LILFIKDDFVKESLKEVFKKLLIEEIQFTLQNDKAKFITYLRAQHESDLITYEKLCQIKHDYPAFSVEDTKW